jgi:hypothetical protein
VTSNLRASTTTRFAGAVAMPGADRVAQKRESIHGIPTGAACILEEAADNDTIGYHVKILSVPLA